MKYFIVIPTYNESENLPELVKLIFKLHPVFNIVVVDDNSPDGTGAIADAMARKNKSIHVLHRKKKAGLGTAYIEGFKYALSKGAEYIFEMDADFSHKPDYIKDFISAISDADLVIGSRYMHGITVQGWSFRRLLMSKLANIFVARVMVMPVWDFTSGFRCYKRTVLENINLDKIRSDGYAFQIEMVYNTIHNGFSVKEIPIVFTERASGESKISRHIVWEALCLTIRYHAPLRKIIRTKSFFSVDTQKVFNRLNG
jgi:dolichol-phosphate mannosyltransferase